MNSRLLALQATFAGVFLLLALATAKQAFSYPYAHIRYVEGDVQLQRATEPELTEASINHPVTQGDRLWTLSLSRAEIELQDGSSLVRMDERTKVDFADFGEGYQEALFRLWSGSIILRLTEEQASRMRIDTPAGSIYPASAGIFRIDVYDDGRSAVLSVYEGIAELASEGGSVLVRSGQRSVAETGRRPEPSFAFNTARLDEFTRWSDERDGHYARVERIEGLPGEIEGYVDDLQHHGTWRADVQLGSVWYPHVSVGWYPYSQGYWTSSVFGWTWVSYEPWGWAPYHYGRWGYNHYGWYWIPGSYWSPAWVSWSLGPHHVGWCALGYYDRPVAVPYYRGGHAVPRGSYAVSGTEANLGWSYVSTEDFGSRRPARLRVEDVEATASQARILESGAILDRNLQPRTVGAAAMTRMPKAGVGEPSGTWDSGPLAPNGSVETRGVARSRENALPSSPGGFQRHSTPMSNMTAPRTRLGSISGKPAVGGPVESRGGATVGSSNERTAAEGFQSANSRPGAIRRYAEPNDEAIGTSSRSPSSAPSPTSESSRMRSTPSPSEHTSRFMPSQSRLPGSSSRGWDFFSRHPSGRTGAIGTSRPEAPSRGQPTARPSGPTLGGERAPSPTGSSGAARSAGSTRSRTKNKN